MRIGELSKRCRVPVRMLRYYEERGLLRPQRSANGYRRYAEADVERATLVSSLIRSGLTTKLIIPLIGGETPPGGQTSPSDELVSLLTAERDKLDAKIACMTLSRNAIESHLVRLDATRRRRSTVRR